MRLGDGCARTTVSRHEVKMQWNAPARIRDNVAIQEGEIYISRSEIRKDQ